LKGRFTDFRPVLGSERQNLVFESLYQRLLFRENYPPFVSHVPRVGMALAIAVPIVEATVVLLPKACRGSSGSPLPILKA
jgi:hypothetical protein